MTEIRPPAARPCGSCPYRRDVPSGVWAADEYDKLPAFDGETWSQPQSTFLCHQQDGRLCAGWVGCHDMANNLGLRIALVSGWVSPETLDAVLDYETDVPLFASGADAAAHGLARIEDPDPRARREVARLSRKIEARNG